MSTLNGKSVASTYDQIVKRQDTYSATGNQIEIMDDSGVIKTTELYLDATNSRVGIGDDTPDYKLDVAGTLGVDGNATFGGTINGTEIHTTATNNLGLGTNAVDSITTGDYNVGVGDHALTSNTTGSYNTASGLNSLRYNTTGDNNTASGVNSLRSNTTGGSNTATGKDSLYSNTTGTENTAIGFASLHGVTTGNNNTAIGNDAGRATSPSGNITTGSNIICLGDSNIANAHIQVAWTVASDERDKNDITDMTNGLDVINNITPINYVWDSRSRYWENVEEVIDEEGNVIAPASIIKHTADGTKKSTDIRTGFSAQNVKSALDAVGYEGNSVVNSEDDEHLKITETNLIPFLVNAVKELSAQNEELSAKVEALENK